MQKIMSAALNPSPSDHIAIATGGNGACTASEAVVREVKHCASYARFWWIVVTLRRARRIGLAS